MTKQTTEEKRSLNAEFVSVFFTKRKKKEKKTKEKQPQQKI